MISANFAAEGADKLYEALKSKSLRIQPTIDGVTRTYAQVMVTRVQAKASGRPGPNAPTGDYRRSWNVKFRKVGGAIEADIGTNKPQGRRLEFGFHGTDSLGRSYDQAAFPHVWPAASEVFPDYEKAVLAAVVL